MALEQTINKSQKATSAIIGCTRKKDFVAMWELIYHEMLAISSLHREISGVKTSAYDSVVNHEFSNSETMVGERNVQAIIAVIERNENPFKAEADELKLHNILTREVMTEDIRKQLLTVNEIGSKAYGNLRRERLVEKSIRFSATIHRTNLKTFRSIHDLKGDRKITRKSSVQKEFAYQQRIIEVARARGSSMDELLQYDVTPSQYLFDSDGLMTKAVKSSLVHELEKTLTKEDQQAPRMNDKEHTTVIVDIMANVRKIKSTGVNTFGKLCSDTLDYIKNVAKGAKRIDMVFDSYLEKSIKDSERRRRQSVVPIELNVIHDNTPLPVEMDRFWKSSSNKQKLQILLHHYAIEQAITTSPDLQLYASQICGDHVVPCYLAYNRSTTEVSKLCIDIEEADSRFVPHSMHAVKHGTYRIVVLSSDTDVSILIMYYWNVFHSFGLYELWVKAGVGDSTRWIPIHILAPRLGMDLCKVLPAIHTLTGWDYTSKVGTKVAALKANECEHLSDFGIIANDSEVDNLVVKAEESLTKS